MQSIFVSLEILFMALPARLAHAQGQLTLAGNFGLFLAVRLGFDAGMAVLALGVFVHGVDKGFGRNVQRKNFAILQFLDFTCLVMAFQTGLCFL